MSCWIVSKRHIDYLVTAMIDVGLLSPVDGADEPTIAGRLLWTSNVASVAYRYRDDDAENLPGPIEFVPPSTYIYAPYVGDMSLIKTLKAVHCYNYQSCERPDYEQSLADGQMLTLEAEVLSRLPAFLQEHVLDRYSPGHTVSRVFQTREYDDAPWGID